MTLEQVLAKLDEIAMGARTVEQCAICHKSYILGELTECGSCGVRLCTKCERRMHSSPASQIRSQTNAA